MSDAPVTAANTPTYFDERQKKGLSDLQHAILRRALDEEVVRKRWRIELEPFEVPAATGLERRGLVRTDRPTRGPLWSSRPGRAVPGTKRTLWLTKAGRGVAQTLPSAVAVVRPVDLDEAKAMAHELATLVTEHKRLTAEDQARAQEILERLYDDEVLAKERRRR